MAENSGRSRRDVIRTLSQAHEVGQFVSISCEWCNIRRNYLPDDLRKVVGDVDIDHITRQMRCEKCRRRGYLTAVYWFPSAHEKTTLTVRRLAEIRMVRRIIWRDSSPGQE